MASKTIWRLPQVMAHTGLSRSSVYSKMASHEFPRSVSLGGPRAVGWIEDEVEQWIQDRIDASRSVQADDPNP